MKRKGYRGAIVIGMLTVTAWSLVTAEAATIKKGTLSVSDGNRISDSDLAAWIDEFIPNNSNRLAVLTQCYGGNAATAFAGKANTAVASATSPGQTAKYGKYDIGAANALKPGAGRTGTTVHDAGIASKDATETPTTGGGMGLGGFSLEDTVAVGPIQSRHVLVYAGKPDNKANRDVDQRNAIKNNFAGKVNTTVTTVGGAGGGGWDKPGSAKGLREALKEIGQAINASPDSSKEQFVLFVTDHGDLHKTETRVTTVPGTSTRKVTDDGGLETFRTGLDLQPSDLLIDPDNTMSFSFFVDFHENGLLYDPTDGPFFNPGSWAMTLENIGGSGPMTLNSFFDVFTELSVDGTSMVGDVPGEGVTLYFPVDENLMISSFFDVFTEISLTNFTSNSYIVSEVSQDTGAIAKTPEPATLGLLTLGAACLRRRRNQVA